VYSVPFERGARSSRFCSVRFILTMARGVGSAPVRAGDSKMGVNGTQPQKAQRSHPAGDAAVNQPLDRLTSADFPLGTRLHPLPGQRAPKPAIKPYRFTSPAGR
jgi:hypothetical protein